MLSWIIQITIISIVLIFLVHYLINFFKTTLTVPKMKDLVNIPTKKYENMYNIISSEPKNKVNVYQEETPPSTQYSEFDLLPKPDTDTMKNELKNFLKKQLNTISTPSSATTDISLLDSSTFSYSDF